jgi:hypothetical protein
MSVAKRENIIVAAYFIFTLIMTNPPVVNWVSNYAETTPLIFGWPTLWVWLQFWYLAMIGGLIWFGMRFKSWNVDYIEESVEQQIGGGE